MNHPQSLSVRSILAAAALPLAVSPALADDWYSWRGPSQDGRSAEKYEKNTFSEKPAWTYDISSRGAPVIASGRIFLFGYHGQGSDGSPWQVYLKLNNLTNKLAYAHTSFIKNAAPLQGRSVSVGFVKAF